MKKEIIEMRSIYRFAVSIVLLIALALCFSGCTIGLPDEGSLNDNTETRQTVDLGYHDQTGDTLNRIILNYHNQFGNTLDSVLFGYNDLKYYLYNGVLYFPSVEYGIEKFNPKTGLVSSACIDPGCLHKDESCQLFESHVPYIDYIRDNVIHWTEQIGMYGGECRYYTYDMNTGIKDLIYVAPVGGTYTRRMWEYQGKYYFKIGTLKEGGDPTNSKDYEMSVVEVDSKTKAQKTAFIPEGRSDDIDTILENGRVVITHDGNIYTANLDGSDMRFVTKGFSSYGKIVGNKLYTIAYEGRVGPLLENGPILYSKNEDMWWPGMPEDFDKSEYVGITQGASYCQIYCTDMTTGETVKVVEEPVKSNNLMISDKYIYYQPFDYHLTGGTRYYKDLEYPGHKTSNTELIRVDLDGGNRTVVSNKFWYEMEEESVAVFGDYLIAKIEDSFNEETKEYDDSLNKKYVLYDLLTGEITELTFLN